MKRNTTAAVMSGKTFYILIIAAIYVIWASAFIFKSSFVAPDGNRHFCLFDDAMISMRYAWNLAHGNGLVWNPGEYVEGITNMLMTLFMAIPAAIFGKSTAVLFVQVSGIAFMLGIAYFCMKIGTALLEKYKITGAGFLEPLFFAVPLAYYPLSYWSLMGMETGLLALLLTASIWQALGADGDTTPKPILAVLLGLAFLTRPDAAIPIGLIYLYRLSGLVKKKGAVKTLAIETGITAAFFLGLTLFRLFYYGNPVPNTYTLKVSGIPISSRLSNGLIFITPFLKLILFPLCINLFSVFVRRSRLAALILLMMLAAVGYQVYVGGDFVVYWRMLAQYVPLFYILSLVEVAEIARTRLESVKRGGARTRKTIVLIAFLVFAVRFNWVYKGEILLTTYASSIESNHHNVKVALALQDITTQEATIGVSWGGSITYFSGRKSIDYLGKSDPYIAKLPPDLTGPYPVLGMRTVPGHNKYDLEYSIVKLKPDYTQHTRYGKQNKEKYVHANYRFIKHMKVNLWLRKDSPHVLWEKLEKK